MDSVKDTRGFTLIEVLVAITVLAIGLLGVAGMQNTAITTNRTSGEWTRAVQLTQEMMDRVRVNAGTSPGNYDGLDTGGTCPTTEPAKGDCEQWQQRLQLQDSGLLDAVGTVDVASSQPIGNTATVTVTLTWGGAANRHNVSFRTILETWGT